MPWARPHLFKRLTLIPSRFTSISPSLARAAQKGSVSYALSEFLELLRQPTCTIPAYVRVLHFHPHMNTSSQNLERVQGSLNKWHHSTLPTMVSEASVPRRLGIYAMKYSELVWDCNPLDIVSAFPSLEKLELWIESFRLSTGHRRMFAPATHTLHTVTLFDAPGWLTSQRHVVRAWRRLIAWLYQKNIRNIKTLHLCDTDVLHDTCVPELLKLYHSTLAHLYIEALSVKRLYNGLPVIQHLF